VSDDTISMVTAFFDLGFSNFQNYGERARAGSNAFKILYYRLASFGAFLVDDDSTAETMEGEFFLMWRTQWPR
jgi:hypothetical protein